MTWISRSLMWVMMVQHKNSDQYLTSGKVSTRSIHGFKRYRLLKTLTKNFNILSNADADADMDADANADAVVSAIALLVLSYRRAKFYTSIKAYETSKINAKIYHREMTFHRQNAKLGQVMRKCFLCHMRTTKAFHCCHPGSPYNS